MSKAIATAFYVAPYAGRIAIQLVPIRTTRHGAKVVRYRWQGEKDPPRYAAPFASVEGAIRAAGCHALISDIVRL